MPALSPTEVEHFLQFGFVKLEQALDQTVIARCVDRMWDRLGYDRRDPATWKAEKVHMPVHEHFRVAEVAPRVHGAMTQLCGGAERMREPGFGDAFVANFSLGRGKPWQPPGPEAEGWHKDGDFFLHFLDSPEQGLLSIVLWSDVLPKGGATFIACDSIAHVARWLAAHPEGCDPFTGFPTRQLIRQCRDFREATGRAGDVYLLHPFMLHASSRNALGVPRLITNPPVHLREPMRFDRERAEDQSPIERAILRGLGAERYAFRPTAERRAIVPPRIAMQEQMKRDEAERLAKRPA